MPEQDKKQQDQQEAVVALGDIRRKPAGGVPPASGVCGDIGLKIGRDGTWYYQGSAIQRKPLVKLFASVLRKEDDQHYFLVTPVEKVPIAVEDAPFLAVEMTVAGSGKDQRLSFRTSLDEVVTADAAHPFRFRNERDGSFTPFISLRDGLEARLACPVYYELVAAAVTDGGVEGEALGVWSGGSFFPFPATLPEG
jgi:uncharacterized protein